MSQRVIQFDDKPGLTSPTNFPEIQEAKRNRRHYRSEIGGSRFWSLSDEFGRVKSYH